MEKILKALNTGLLVLLVFLILFGLLIRLSGNEVLTGRLFFAASVFFPFILATKGMEYMISNQMFKALLSILLLSLICVISIIFVFV